MSSLPFLKKFFTKTAFGRTLSGRNKTGQAVGAIINPILTLTGLKPAKEALGYITSAGETQEIAEAKKTDPRTLRLNLSANEERLLRLGVTGLVILLTALGVDLGDILAQAQSAIQAAQGLLDTVIGGQ